MKKSSSVEGSSLDNSLRKPDRARGFRTDKSQTARCNAQNGIHQQVEAEGDLIHLGP